MIKNNKPSEVVSLTDKKKFIESIVVPYKESHFLVYENNDFETVTSYKIDAMEYNPISPYNPYITRGVLKLPTEALDYGTEEELLLEIQKYIHTYVDITPQFEIIASYYVLMTWIYERFNYIPYLRVIGDYGSGKSTFLEVVGSISKTSMTFDGASSLASLFRNIDRYGGTMVLDEADLDHSSHTSDMVRVLNQGFKKGGCIQRCNGDTNEPEPFTIFGPKIMATRSTFKDQALESRFLVEYMGTREMRSSIKEYDDTAKLWAQELQNKLLMWKFHNQNRVLDTAQSKELPIQPRLQQISGPLLTLMKNPDHKREFISFMKSYHSELADDRSSTWEAHVLQAIFDLIQSTADKQLKVSEIANQTNVIIFDISNETLDSGKVGKLMKQRLHLKTKRIGRGTFLDTQTNAEHLNRLYQRYGVVTDEVNRVNEVEAIDPMDPEANPFL
jgi:hypothetical protein